MIRPPKNRKIDRRERLDWLSPEDSIIICQTAIRWLAGVRSDESPFLLHQPKGLLVSQSTVPPTVGRVYLVGAGPGDPGLLTVRGQELLRQADLVLYDGLVNPLLLHYAHANAERTARVTEHGERVLPQETINQRLIAAAKEGKTVVRLKGGDPFIFGRGSEEAAALEAEGIPFEVVPGITAATAAAVYAGLSLTHRDHASAVAFVTGHEDPNKADSSLNYASLANFPGTLVFYMGLHRLPQIAESLMTHGKSPTTPALVISRATTPFQQTVEAPLNSIAAAANTRHLPAPSLVIVGDCVTLRSQVAWFEKRPLLGQVIGIPRPETAAEETMLRAAALGASPLAMPTIEITPLDDYTQVDRALDELPSYHWLILTSVQGVDALLERLWSRGGDARRLASVKLAAIGPATAAALARWKLQVDLVPPAYRGEELANALAPHVAQRRVLWARASRGRDVLPTLLREAGATCDELVVYQNRDVEALAPAARMALIQGQVNWIGLSSPAIARRLAALLPPEAKAWLEPTADRPLRLCSISPVTTAAAQAAGLPIAAEAQVYTWEGVFAAIMAASC